MTSTDRNLDRRKQIVRVARLLLMQRGVEGFTIEETAQMARASKATLYRWWGGKTALVQEAMAERSVPPIPDTGTLHGDLRSMMRSIADVQHTAGRILLGIALAMQDDAAIAAAWRENGVRSSGAARMQAILDRAIARGELSGPPDLLSLHTVIAGTMIWHFAVERDADSHAFADRFLRTVLLPAIDPWLTDHGRATCRSDAA